MRTAFQSHLLCDTGNPADISFACAAFRVLELEEEGLSKQRLHEWRMIQLWGFVVTSCG